MIQKIRIVFVLIRALYKKV